MTDLFLYFIPSQIHCSQIEVYREHFFSKWFNPLIVRPHAKQNCFIHALQTIQLSSSTLTFGFRHVVAGHCFTRLTIADPTAERLSITRATSFFESI